MPITKKDEKKLEELGYEFSHHEKNHVVYKHTVIKYPHKGHLYRVSKGSKTNHFKQFLQQVQATVKQSLEAIEAE